MVFRSDLPGQSAQAALAALLAERGPLANKVAVRAQEIAAHEGKVANILLDLWENHGVGDLTKGQLRLCVPSELREGVELIFRHDPDFIDDAGQPAVHAVAHTAFGDLFLWSERHWLVHVNIVLGLVEAPFLHRPASRSHPDTVALDMLLRAEGPLLDMVDAEGNPMFERARSAFDPLPRMVIYAPGKAMTADPIPSFDQLYAAHYPEWLADRARSKVWYLSDIATGRPNIRKIGAAG
jgi:hypothetical protein